METINTEFQSLIAGTEISVLSTSVTIASGQNLKRGAVLGIVTADNKAKLVDKTKSDGSQVASLILAEDVDATAADVVGVAYKTGVFNTAALYVAAGDTVEDHADELRKVNIHLRANY